MVKPPMNEITFWTGIIGATAGMIGCIAGIFALYDRLWHRKPRLSLFAPYYFTGQDSVTGQPIFAAYLRIANSSKASAFLYLETTSLKVFCEGKWHKTRRLEIDTQIKKLTTDLPKFQQSAFGLAEAPLLRKFGCSLVTFEQPLCGYIVVGHPNRQVLKGASKIKIAVEDCHFRMHTMIVDFQNNSMHDPDCLPET